MKQTAADKHYIGFKHGCPLAFKAIYTQYQRQIYWMGRSLIKDVFVVETLVQDTFLTLWEKREQIESPQHLVNFLYTVISNECKWYYARPRNQFNRECFALENIENYQSFMLGYDPTVIDIHLEDQQQQQKEYEQVVKVLPLLGAQRQHLIKLCLQHGFKYKTISEQLGISIKETSNTLQHTIEEIKNILHQGYVLQPQETEPMQNGEGQMTEQEARVLALRCEQQYSFAQIANELQLSQKEVHRAFTTAYKLLQQHQHLQSA